MEAFDLDGELQIFADGKGWLFFNGDEFHANIEADEEALIGQLALWVNVNADETRANQGNRLQEINYTGEIALGIKFDANFDDEDPATANERNANLDETFRQKRERRLKELLQVLSEELGVFACSNQLNISTSSFIYDLNRFDTNFDFVVGNIVINQEYFSESVNEVDLTLTAGEGGSVEPYEGTQSQTKYSTVAINAVPDSNRSFTKWVIDGVDNLNSLTTVFMNKTKEAIAYFERLFITIQDVFGTTPIDQKFIDQVGNNDVTYKNVQVAKSDGVSTIVNTGINASDNLVMAFVGRFVNPNNDSQFVGGFSTNNRFYIGPTGGNWAIGYGTTFNRSELISDDENHLFIVNNNKAWILDPQKLDDNIIKNIIDNVTPTLTTNSASEPHPTIDIFGLSGASIFIEMEMQEFALSNYDGNIYTNLNRLNFQDGDGDVLIDISGNEDNSLVTGGILADFRGTYIDGIDSVLINNGYTLFRQIADPNIIITAAYDINGIPTLDANTPPSGYSNGVEIPKNVVSDNRILYDGIQVAGIETDATFTDINSLENSTTIEINKDANTVSNLKIKA